MSGRKVVFVDLPGQYEEIKDEVEPVILNIMRAAGYIGGPQVDSFEKEFAEYLGVKHCVAMSSGTAALHYILRAIGTGPGDEVITAANTFIATAEAIALTGATVKLVDIEPDGVHPSEDSYMDAVTDRTKAIIPVHLFGLPMDINSLVEFAAAKGIKVIEDSCQAHGARLNGKTLGVSGYAAAYSFYPGKNLGAFGDAGAVVTDDDDLAARMIMIRNHGLAKKHDHQMIGSTERMDATLAVGLRAKLRRLDGWNKRRRKIAERYIDGLKGIDGLWFPRENEGQESCYHLFVIRHARRDELSSYLNALGLETGMHYPVPIHLSQAFAFMGKGPGSFPNTERACATGLSLPMHPHLTDGECDYVIEAIRKFP